VPPVIATFLTVIAVPNQKLSPEKKPYRIW